MRTTIEITAPALDAYKRMTARYSIKNAVSAAIMALAKMTPEERESQIDEAVFMPEDKIKDAAELILSAEPFEVIKILGQNEQKILNELRMVLGPSAADVVKRAEVDAAEKKGSRSRKNAKPA